MFAFHCEKERKRPLSTEVFYAHSYCRRLPPAMAIGILLPTIITILSLGQSPTIREKGQHVHTTKLKLILCFVIVFHDSNNI